MKFIGKIERWLWITLLLSVFIIQINIPELNKQVSAKGANDADKKLNLLWKVIKELRDDYIDIEKASVDRLVYGAIKGMLNELEDPHTFYLSPKRYKELFSETRGSFGGLGLYVDKKDDQLIVINSIEDAPARAAGILNGDIIHKIDGKFTYGMSLNEVASKLKGAINTSVHLTIIRDGEDKPINFKINREEIKIKSVVFKPISEENVGYIKIRNFSLTTLKDIKIALKTLIKQGSESLILDLRYNPGGLLTAVCDVTDLFIDKGSIVYTKNRDNRIIDKFDATPKILVPMNIPIVVLINQYSASASEVLAGALQDHKRAILVGEKTFGKFSVQEVKQIDPREKTAYKLTTAYYYIPSGRSLHLTGLEPDIYVPTQYFNDYETEIIDKRATKSLVAVYVKRFRNTSEDFANLAFLQDKLKKENIFLSIEALNYLVYQELTKRKPPLIYNLDFDHQLKEAVKILKSHRILNDNDNNG